MGRKTCEKGYEKVVGHDITRRSKLTEVNLEKRHIQKDMKKEDPERGQERTRTWCPA